MHYWRQTLPRRHERVVVLEYKQDLINFAARHTSARGHVDGLMLCEKRACVRR
jgi:hypothetical protein